MRDRIQTVLQRLPAVLGGILGLQLVLIFLRPNPVADLEVPVAPRWHPENHSYDAISNHSESKVIASPKSPTSKDSHRSVSSTDMTTDTHQIPGARSNHPARHGTNGLSPKEPMIKTGEQNPRVDGGPPVMMVHGAIDSAHVPPAIPRIIQARIEKITQSELLAPVFHPPPMALLGIAGHDAFLRTPNGQMSLLREGGESDGLKLLRIGTNRVLVEVSGEKTELTIFEGIGGESLLPK